MQIAQKRLSEHESVLIPSTPSVTACTNDILRFFAALSAQKENA